MPLLCKSPCVMSPACLGRPLGGTRICSVEYRLTVTPFGKKENWIVRKFVSSLPQSCRDLYGVTNDKQKDERRYATVTLGSALALRNHPLMGDAAISIRLAKPDDADGIARVYVESWHDTYAAILPMRLLCAMTPRGQAARWRQAVRTRGEAVFVAQHEQYGVVGMASCGRSRDRALPFDGEIYTLYVDPSLYGCGIGRALLAGAFGWMADRQYESCVIWAHAKNNARFFYEKMGGRLVAERAVKMMGDPVPEAAFGWRKLALAEGASSR